MKTTDISIYRIKHLINKEFVVNQLFLNLIGYMVIAFFIGIFIKEVWLFGALVIGNFINSFESEQKTTDLFLLPANTFEKFIAKLLYWFVIFPLFAFAAYTFGFFVGQAFAGDSFHFNNITITMLVLLFGQSVFWFGCVYFRKNSFLKSTALFLIIFALLIGVPNLTEFILSFSYPYIDALERYEILYNGAFWNGLKIWGSAILTLLMIVSWTATYFALKEKEA